jgi:hypothetical protein
MPASDRDHLTEIQGYLDRARDEYRQLRSALSEAMRGHPADLAGHLIAHTEELGVDATLDALSVAPERFGLASADGLPMAQLRVLLPEIADRNWEIGGLTGEREDLLGRHTIADGRIFNLDGREATLDLATKRFRYLDQTAEPIDIVAVETDGGLPPTRKRSRRRERDR